MVPVGKGSAERHAPTGQFKRLDYEERSLNLSGEAALTAYWMVRRNAEDTISSSRPTVTMRNNALKISGFFVSKCFPDGHVSTERQPINLPKAARLQNWKKLIPWV